ncbi:MAG: hypothetical protein JO038_00880 [Alphaproteobacteria bacterium]|nr:hypothetical protein [Alphaproteobacteria bacterium]
MGGTLGRVMLGAMAALWPALAAAQGLPAEEGSCVRTQIARLEQRLQSGETGPFIAGSGSVVRFANGGYQVSYDEVDAVQHSRAGDPVMMCLVRLPQKCPPGDARGRWYTTTNLRTMQSWTMMDSEHSCGGA